MHIEKKTVRKCTILMFGRWGLEYYFLTDFQSQKCKTLQKHLGDVSIVQW